MLHNTSFVTSGSQKSIQLLPVSPICWLQFCEIYHFIPGVPVYLWKSRAVPGCFPEQEACHFSSTLLFLSALISPLEKNQKLSDTGQRNINRNSRVKVQRTMFLPFSPCLEVIFRFESTFRLRKCEKGDLERKYWVQFLQLAWNFRSYRDGPLVHSVYSDIRPSNRRL